MDLNRLYAAIAEGNATKVSPHLVADVLTGVKRKGYAKASLSCVTLFPSLDFTIKLNDDIPEVHVRRTVEGDCNDVVWFYASMDNKIVRFNPCKVVKDACVAMKDAEMRVYYTNELVFAWPSAWHILTKVQKKKRNQRTMTECICSYMAQKPLTTFDKRDVSYMDADMFVSAILLTVSQL